MIIAIAAPPIVDKSNALMYLSKKYDLDIYNDPTPQVCLQYGFRTLYEMPSDMQISARSSLIDLHLKYITQNTDILLSHSVFEWLADWMRWFWSSTHTNYWARIMEMAASCIDKYDIIYHFDNGDPMKYNGYVWLDKENSKQINSIIKYLYLEYGIAEKIRYKID